MAVLDNLEPKQVFHFFEELCKIPHATFDTKRISDYCVAFAKERGLEVDVYKRQGFLFGNGNLSRWI